MWGLGTDATGVGRGLLSLVAWAADEGLGNVEHTVSREAALRAVTAGNAALLGQADALGTLSEGRLAGIVVLDRNITDPSVSIRGARVLMTIVGGRIVHRDGI